MCGVFCCNETEKGKKNEQYFYEEKNEIWVTTWNKLYNLSFLKEFHIHFKEKDIVAGKFDTFDDIIKLINKEIAYKTRGKEHA